MAPCIRPLVLALVVTVACNPKDERSSESSDVKSSGPDVAPSSSVQKPPPTREQGARDKRRLEGMKKAEKLYAAGDREVALRVLLDLGKDANWRSQVRAGEIAFELENWRVAAENLERAFALWPMFFNADDKPTAAQFEKAQEQIEHARKHVAKLTVTAKPKGATIYVDGRELGPTLQQVWLDPGEHEVLVKKPSFEDSKRSVTVAAGKYHDVTVPLTRSEG